MRLLTITMVVFSLSSLRLQNSPNDVIGKWECYHKELKDGTTKETNIFTGREFEYSCKGLMIELRSDLTGWESFGGLKFTYRRTDSILKMGNRNYVIEFLNQNELVIRDYDPKGIKLSNFRQKFKRQIKD